MNLNTETCASLSASKRDDYDFRRNCAQSLSSFRSNTLGLRGLFGDLGAQKGLLNYDESNDIETLLKNIVNLHKNALDNVQILCDNIPGLGPILGPGMFSAWATLHGC
jgi:hypothetical protein